MGRALAPLRESGVLILGSGGMVHNLQRLDWRGGNGEPEAWAADFDAWAAEALSKGDSEALLDWQRRAPEAQVAHPSTEHWDPLLVTLGAAGGAPPSTIFQGWEMRNLSLRCVSWS